MNTEPIIAGSIHRAQRLDLRMRDRSALAVAGPIFPQSTLVSIPNTALAITLGGRPLTMTASLLIVSSGFRHFATVFSHS